MDSGLPTRTSSLLTSCLSTPESVPYKVQRVEIQVKQPRENVLSLVPTELLE